MHQGPGAHRARFNCSKQFTVFQTVVTNGCTCFPQSDDLGMGRGVGAGDVAIPSAPYDPAVANHDRAHWNFSRFERALGAAEGFFHPEFVRSQFVGGGLGS
jgi:hypothetical protein